MISLIFLTKAIYLSHILTIYDFCGEYSSVGRAPGCGSGGRGFKPHYSPHFMEFNMSAMFWGLLLIAFGITLILETILKIDIPFFKILFALALIYWGLSILLGTSIKTQIDSTCEYIKVVFEEKR